MRPLLAATLLLTLACSSTPDPLADLTVPEGFELIVAAAPPLVERPMIVDQDDQGRLYVAESSGSNDPVEQQLKEAPHRILRLIDDDNDGVYDRRTVFADKLMLPEGVLWTPDAVYVAAPPVIWKFTDPDDDGVADTREAWYDAKTLTGCANDLHGPYLGPDGWIYWAKGAFAEQTHEITDGSTLTTRAAHIFRRRPEGGPVEAVLTGGMDNPVEVAFLPNGERFITSTFLQHPELGRRDGIIHAVYGGVYGKIHNVVDGHPMTGGFLPPVSHLGPAAPVGLLVYQSPSFGPEYRLNLFATMFNMHKVTRHVLTLRGATYQSEDSDFLVSSNPDFHSTDVHEDKDGSLLVVDTGAWYKLCCPTSQLAKPDVLGAIYRVRAKAPAAPAATTSTDEATDAVWALARDDSPASREAIRKALRAPDESVRHVAAHAASLLRDAESAPALRELLTQSPPLRRVAAEALGRIGDREAVPALLAAAAEAEDEVLAHSLTYALIEIADPVATRRGLQAASPKARRAAMLALDQMSPAALDPKTVLPLLSSNDPLVKQTAVWIAGRRPEWGGALAGSFGRRLAAGEPEIEDQLVRFTGSAAVQAVLAKAARTGPANTRQAALRVMSRALMDETPASWTGALASTLAGSSGATLDEAVRAVKALPRAETPDPQLQASLFAVARNATASDQARVDALAAALPAAQATPADAFALLTAKLDPEHPVRLRGAAAQALAAAPLSRDQQLLLADVLPSAGPLELPRLLDAFASGGDAELGEKLIASLTGAPGLRRDLLESLLENFPPKTSEQAAPLLAQLDQDREQQQERLETLLASLDHGDIRRGQAVFNSEKAACISCHSIGYAGGEVGPDLTKIGEIRERRDLLEAVLYPSASFVRSYEPLIVATQDDVLSGVPVEETDDWLVLATGADEQVRIPRSEIEEVRPGKVSVMPSGLEGELTEQELADLLAFLAATRRGA